MTSAIVTKCSMCFRDMIPVATKSGTSPDYVWCPNCDNPDGEKPNNDPK